MPTPVSQPALSPLPYHLQIVDYLQLHEPEVWRWACARGTDAEQRSALRAALLRETYRLEREAHPDAHAALDLAMQRLGIAVPATLYQSPGQDMNAALAYVPGEVHIMLQGPLLERLSQQELLAVMGHELSHYLLWSRDDGELLVAERILADALGSGAATASHHETFRRYALHTELFADRGAAVAAEGIAPAVSALVKIQTGIGHVDAASYLQQAAELDAQEAQSSAAPSHPEVFIRARALALWWDNSPDLDVWLAKRLHGPLFLDRLDLPGQIQLQAVTRGIITFFLSDDSYASDAVLAQVRAMFPDWQPGETALQPAQIAGILMPSASSLSAGAYLNALLIDLAMADPELRERALLRAGGIALSLGTFDGFAATLSRDAAMDKRALDKYKQQLDKEIQA